jgi:hypothetical protein
MSEPKKVEGSGPSRRGRKPGVPNKTTTEFRQIIQNLIDRNAANVEKWLAQVAKDDPDKALRHIANLAEYASPKLQRTELAGHDGGPITVTIQKVA